MSEIVSIDYPTVAVSLLVEHFKDSFEFKNLIEAISAAQMPLQSAILEIRDRFVLATATGSELTIIGTVWDEDRESQTDEALRTRINIKISLNMSGNLVEIKKVLFLLYGATYVKYNHAYPAGFNLTTDALITQDILTGLTAAGVFGLWWPSVSAGNYIVDANYDAIVGADTYPIIDNDI